MQNDWNSLFFYHTPHHDQISHEDRLLRDVGLTRTATGDLALAEDPTHLVVRLPQGAPPHTGWLRALVSLFTPASVATAISKVSGGSRPVLSRSACER